MPESRLPIESAADICDVDRILEQADRRLQDHDILPVDEWHGRVGEDFMQRRVLRPGRRSGLPRKGGKAGWPPAWA